MNKRVVMAVVLASMACVAFSPAGAVASRPMAAFIKFDGLMAGAGSDKDYPDSVVVTNVLIGGTRVETCAAVQRLDDDPIGALLDDDPVGMITVQIALTKNYLDKASPKLRHQARIKGHIEQAVLAINDGGKRCALTFSKLSRLAVTRRAKFDEVTILFEGVEVTLD